MVVREYFSDPSCQSFQFVCFCLHAGLAYLGDRCGVIDCCVCSCLISISIGSHVRNALLDILSAIVLALICTSGHCSFDSELLADSRATRILLIAIVAKCACVGIGYHIPADSIVIVFVTDLIAGRVILIKYSGEDRIGLFGTGVMIETVHEWTIRREVAIEHHLDQLDISLV